MTWPSPWSNQIINTLIVGGNAGGVFVYSGAPALGNPPIFYASSQSVDPFGNPITPTVGLSGIGQFNAGNTIINVHGMFFYSGTPAANNLIGSNTEAAGTDAFNNAYLQGNATYFLGISNWTAIANQSLTGGAQTAWYYTTGLTETGWVQGGQWIVTAGVASPSGSPLQYQANGQGLLIGTINPELVSLNGALQMNANGPVSAKVGFATVYAGATGNNIGVVPASGLPGPWPFERSLINLSAFTVTQTTATQIGASLAIPAADFNANAEYECEIDGTITMGATAETLTFSLADGGVAIGPHVTMGAIFLAASSTFFYTLRLRIAINNTTTAIITLDGGINKSANVGSESAFPVINATMGVVSSGVSFNSTIAHTLEAVANFGGAGGQTMTTNRTKWVRRGP
jgi:hypothetical protein